VQVLANGDRYVENGKMTSNMAEECSHGLGARLRMLIAVPREFVQLKAPKRKILAQNNRVPKKQRTNGQTFNLKSVSKKDLSYAAASKSYTITADAGIHSGNTAAYLLLCSSLSFVSLALVSLPLAKQILKRFDDDNLSSPL
jgi:hypothetical protein